MPKVQLMLDSDTYRLLIKSAVAAQRPIAWQAETLLRQALMAEAKADNSRRDDGDGGRRG